MDRSRTARRGAVDRLLWRRFGPDGGSTGAMRRVFGRAASVPAGCRRVAGAAFVWDRLLWARVTDVAKRRRQGLVVCRAALPFEGLFDARPGVALAPTFVAWVACQSRTVRA